MRKLAVLTTLLAIATLTVGEISSAKEISDVAVFRQIGRRCMAKQLDMSKLKAALDANANSEFAESSAEIVLNYNPKEYDRLIATGVSPRIARAGATEYLWADQTEFCATYRSILFEIQIKSVDVQ